MGQMTISARSRSRLTGALHTHGAPHVRRREQVWLTPQPAAALDAVEEALSSEHITGALALDPAHTPNQLYAARQCALVVERDPALARKLKQALVARYESRFSVRLVSSSARSHLARTAQTPDVLIVDANEPEGTGKGCYAFAEGGRNLDATKVVYITRATSFGLSQRGVTHGALLRASTRIDEMVDLVAALVD